MLDISERISWILWHINLCWSFNAKSSLYMYMFNWFGLVGFYRLLNAKSSLYIYIIWVLWHINLCRLLNAKSSLYIYIICISLYICIICTHILYITFLNKPKLISFAHKWFQILLYNSHDLISVIHLHTVCR